MKYMLFVVFVFTSLFSSSTNEILLLHSYNKGLKWSDGISEGLEDVLKEHPKYELTTEYMDSKKTDSKEYFDLLVALYKKKFSSRQYKAIVTADNYAYEFVLKNHATLFNKVPIIFCGVENFDKKNIPLNQQKYVTGVVEYKDIRRNLKLIEKFLPSLDTLMIISDNSFSSLAIKQQILSTAEEFQKKFNIVYNNDIDLNTLPSEVNALSTNSAILFTSLYKDKYGQYIPYNELKTFFQNSKVPIFALNKIHLGEGVLGGVMIKPYDQGYVAGKKIFEILKGKSPLQIDVTTPIGQVYFDQNILNKFKYSKNNVPLGATVINKPEDFFEKNRKFIDSIFLVMPLLVILIIFLIIGIYKKISLEIMLIEQSKLDNVLLNNVTSAIFWKSNEGLILGCNSALCEIINRTKDDIVGKYAHEVIPEVCNTVLSYDSFIDEVETKLYNTAKGPINVIIRRQKYLNNKNQLAGIVTTITNITDLKKLEKQRQKNEQFLIQRSKLSEIGEMMTSIAHQWKTPLVEISSISQELQYKRKKMQLSQEDTDDFVDEIMTQVHYMTDTIDDFRNFIKPSTHKSEFSVNNAIKELLHVIDHNIKYNYIKVDINYKDSKDYITFGYPNEFKQSILNIINNARDSIIKRKVNEPLEGKISLYIEDVQDMICITIQDNGIGIEKDKLESIFEPFFTTKDDGDGFGLYMAKLIIEDKMGGSIKAIESNSGAKMLICINNTFLK